MRSKPPPILPASLLSWTSSPQIGVNRSGPKPFKRAFSPAVRTATGSISTPTASFAPSSRAAMERMPLPVPISSRRQPGVTVSSSIPAQRRVVWWVPVPKAMPGSRRITTSPSLGAYSSQVGQTTRRLPMGVGW